MAVGLPLLDGAALAMPLLNFFQEPVTLCHVVPLSSQRIRRPRAAPSRELAAPSGGYRGRSRGAVLARSRPLWLDLRADSSAREPLTGAMVLADIE